MQKQKNPKQPLTQENQNRRQATRMRLNQQDDRKLAEMVRDDGWFSPSQEEKAIAVRILKERKAERDAAENH